MQNIHSDKQCIFAQNKRKCAVLSRKTIFFSYLCATFNIITYK